MSITAESSPLYRLHVRHSLCLWADSAERNRLDLRPSLYGMRLYVEYHGNDMRDAFGSVLCYLYRPIELAERSRRYSGTKR
jgi:hypothetical protein